MSESGNNQMAEKIPKVTVGMPVYNSEDLIERAINSILKQTFTDFELIISDNHSTDQTSAICQKYASIDSRIKYIRQPVNIGAEANFKFVLDQATAEFFTWAASDDIRTEDFLEKNIDFLEKNPDYSFSSSPNCFTGQEDDPEKLKTFAIEGNLYQRLYDFLDFALISHACFYSVLRREMLSDHTIAVNPSYLAFDWTVDVHLLSKGKFGRINNGKLILGLGMSTKPDFLTRVGNSWIGNIFPVSEFSKRFIAIVSRNAALTAIEKLLIISKIYRFNIIFAFRQMRIKIIKFLSNTKRLVLR
jgi:glycosyltransferase involved in cell wall biosynthesis